MKLKFFISLLVPTIAVIISTFIMLNWIDDIETYFGWFAWVIIIGMTLIPCFYNVFVITTLLFKQDKKTPFIYPSISIIIAVYNEEDSIIETIESILAQNYHNKIEIIIHNDGSNDKTSKVISEFLYNNRSKTPITMIDDRVNRGKPYAMNVALSKAKYKTIVSLDSDTILYKDALKNIVRKFLSDDYAAVAGAIRVNNSRKNFLTRIQKYDYLYGISSVKRSQSLFNNTLVAQGAFSIYKKSVVERYNWSDTVGEDIVLSWDMLNDGYKIGHATDAIGFTNVPETYSNYFKQRKRWSIGLIEAFRRNGSVLYKPSFGLPFYWNNLLFIYIDFSYMLFFIPGVIAAIFFKFYLLAGIMTLSLIPLSILLSLIIIYKQHRVNKKLGIKNDLHFWGFVFFVLFYQLLQTPACISGYVSEILKLKKNWGTRI